MSDELQSIEKSRQMTPKLKLFALKSSESFGQRVADAMGVKLSPHEEKFQKDGECYFRSLENVRRSSVFLISSVYGDGKQSVNDKIAMISVAVGSLIDASSSEITLVLPYLAYARLDRKVKSREPVGTKIFAQQIEAIGVDRILTMDVHNLSAFQNAFRTCRTDNLEGRIDLVNFMAHELKNIDPSSISFIIPDSGGMVRTKLFRKTLQLKIGRGIGIAFLDKERSGEKIIANKVVGDVRPIMIAVEDMISTGSTMHELVHAISLPNVQRIYAVATHGLFVGNANQNLDLPKLTKIVIADTIEPFRLNDTIRKKLVVVSTAPLFAEAIRRTYTGDSLSNLFADAPKQE